MQLMIVTIVAVLFAFFLFSVRLVFVKDGTFKGTCANNNPMLVEEGAVCGVCGRKPDEPCEND